MATRFYLPSTGTPVLAALAFGSGWNKTSQATRLPALMYKSGTAITNRGCTSSATTPEFHCSTQYQFPGLLAQTISGTLKGQIRAFVNNILFVGTVAIAARVVSSDGTTLRGTLLAPVGSDATTTPPELNTSGTNRPFMDVAESAAITLTSVTAVAGDVLIIEIGVRDVDSGTSRSGTTIVGDPAGSDLPEDSTTVTALAAWVEFSTTLVFAHTGTGAAAVASPPMSAAGAGTSTVPAYTGTGAPSLQKVAAAGAGVWIPAVTGTGAATLQKATEAAAGTSTVPAFTGSGGATLQPMAASGAGAFTSSAVTGSGAATLQKVAASGAGVIINPVTGTGAATLQKVAAAGAGVWIPATTGSGGATLKKITAAGAGSELNAGSGAATLKKVTAAGVGTRTTAAFTGFGAASLKKIAASGVGMVFPLTTLDSDDVTVQPVILVDAINCTLVIGADAVSVE